MDSSGAPALRLSAVTSAAKVEFRHQDGGTGRLFLPEVMGGGSLFADLSGDGLADVYLLNGAPLSRDAEPFESRYFRNTGDGTFVDETARSGLGRPGYAIGCCAGDFDGDGRLDVYVTTLDGNRLYRNEGDGSFTDVTERAGVAAGGFSAGAAFGDADGDGDLDLYVARYVRWSPETDRPCDVPSGGRRVRSVCRPVVYPPLPDLLYRNNGDGTFTDVTRASGLAVPPGRGLGVIWTDFDRDGDQDLYVANDMTANFLFVNDGRGRFTEEGRERGVATDDRGQPQAGMGITTLDYDGDGHLDLAVTNFSDEYLALYRNRGDGTFEDRSARSGLVQATSPYVGFGLTSDDLDLDGLPDLFVANGHVSATEDPRTREALVAPPLCLLNDGRGGFVPVDAGLGALERKVGRGCVAADYDRDGDVDLLVTHWTDSPDLLRNDLLPKGSGTAGPHWLRLELKGRAPNHSAIGALVSVRTGDRVQLREVRSGGSYCSQSELPLTLGLGTAGQARVEVRWPDGSREAWDALAADRAHTLLAGEGSAAGR